MSNPDFDHAAEAILRADGLIVAAGAGMSADSGLPDFRGPQGFWEAYPALGRAKVTFERIAKPAGFRDNVQRTWGFYGHRLQMYREAVPGPSFAILLSIAEQLPHGGFVFTSNVDGQFQEAGFQADRVWECHGSIQYLQCLDVCRRDYWSAKDFVPQVDLESCRLLNAPPTCPSCGAVARPNILMFDDWGWVEDRERMQRAKYQVWQSQVRRPVAIEIGAGTAIPKVRRFSEQQRDGVIIRINTVDALVTPGRGIGLRLPGRDVLEYISMALSERGWRL